MNEMPRLLWATDVVLGDPKDVAQKIDSSIHFSKLLINKILAPLNTASRQLHCIPSYGWYQWQPPSFARGRFTWMSCHGGQIPPGAVPVGKDKDGKPLFVGRANHAGDLLPGKVNPSHHGVYVPYGGGEHMKEQYEVLVSNDIAWKHSHNGEVPPQAMIIGHTSSGENLYCGRAYHDGTITPGKVHPTHGCLYIPYAGQEVCIKEYEIMVLL